MGPLDGKKPRDALVIFIYTRVRPGSRAFIQTVQEEAIYSCLTADGCTVAVDPLTDRVLLDRFRLAITTTRGNFPIAVHPTKPLFYVQHEFGVDTPMNTLSIYRTDGAFMERIDAPYDSGGIFAIRPDGTPIMASQAINTGAKLTVDGKQYPLYWAQEVDGFRAGTADCDEPGWEEVGGMNVPILQKPDGSIWMWPHYVPHRCYLSVFEGEAALAIQGYDPPNPFDLSSLVPFKPYVAPTPVPPPIPLLGLVPPTEPFPACFTGTNQDGGFVAAGNACWSASPENT